MIGGEAENKWCPLVNGHKCVILNSTYTGRICTCTNCYGELKLSQLQKTDTYMEPVVEPQDKAEECMQITFSLCARTLILGEPIERY